MKIQQIKDEWQECRRLTAVADYSPSYYQDFIRRHQTDLRKGVEKLVQSAEKEYKQLEQEEKRCRQMVVFDRQVSDLPAEALIAGVDEVGRGPLAGPIVAAAVILKPGQRVLYANDSKQLSDSRRRQLVTVMGDKLIDYGIGVVTAEQINQMGIQRANQKAMALAVADLNCRPAFVLTDALTLPEVTVPQKAIVKGDQKSMSIALASILAKVTRDDLMIAYDRQYPAYDFASNKGYGTKSHIEALRQQGLTPIHRRLFVRKIISFKGES